MFDIGWTEITFIIIFAIIVIGPKELPRVLRTVGRWVGKAKSMTREFRGHVDDMIHDTELEEVKKQIDSAGSFDLNESLENTIDPDGEIKNTFDFDRDEFSNTVDLDGSSYHKKIDNGGSIEKKSSKNKPKSLTEDPTQGESDEKYINQEKEFKD